MLAVSVPLPGFSGLRHIHGGVQCSQSLCFSPVAGIQWVETWTESDTGGVERLSFSPVAGIQWVETASWKAAKWLRNVCFSPVAGIQWVETFTETKMEPPVKRFSPVAGIQWVETTLKKTGTLKTLKFQSRCRDSVG